MKEKVQFGIKKPGKPHKNPGPKAKKYSEYKGQGR